MEREKESNKSRFLRLIVESHGSTILDGDSAPFYGFYPAQLQRLICLVEQETLERAARLAKAYLQHGYDVTGNLELHEAILHKDFQDF